MRIAIPLVVFFVLLVGCKPAEINFTSADLNAGYVKKLFSVAKHPDSIFNAGKIFMTQLDEDYVNRDGIAEETMVNTKSKKPRLRLAYKGLSYRLYIITTDASRRSSIFLPAIFNADSTCIGLGPAYIGSWGAGELKYLRKLEFYAKKKGEKNIWTYPRKENEYNKKYGIYSGLDSSKSKIEIKFVADVKRNIAPLDSFRVTDIINISENRFGAQKPLIFNIVSIFEDPDALAFYSLRPL